MAYFDDELITEDALTKLFDKLHSFSKESAEFEEAEAQRLLKLQASNAEELYKLRVKLAKDENDFKIKQEHDLLKRLTELQFDQAEAEAAIKRKNSLKEAQAKLKEAKKNKNIAGIADAKAIIAAVKEEYKQRSKEQKKLDKEITLAEKNRQKEAVNAAKSIQSSSGVSLIGSGAEHIYKELRANGYSDEEAKKAISGARKGAAKDIFLNFAQALEGTMKEVADAQGAIDTRMQGSGQRTYLGSYWKAMSQDVTRNVGMSAVVRQADVVNNLKTLVGRGIAFNVEQRAFLETIKDKIATTFETADATLLKLVRIQQADTTAARLGMESALTAFLNNMYETTEYMTDAAKEIRANIYEASALMGATEATAFEYQVQKWMGSLYSVGFSNTSGLSGALGKLAAGDIEGITNGGYGNLLVMAANRAGLSVASMLADGIDDSQTNQLMQAMVEYLGEIYAETKDNRVVAQQMAGVFGLTASDLKAAANLYGSTSSIGRNNLNYGGMLGRLSSMAGSMWQRTSTGAMMGNLFDNFKYAIASSMGNNPVLYSLYHIASMLEDTTGGNPLPAIMTVGTGIDLRTKISEIMKLGALGGGILEGIGTMLAGLGNGVGTAAMLKNFGINNNLTTLTRGTGTGISAMNFATVSESGYVGNANGGDIMNSTMTSATEQGETQVQTAGDERGEIKLSTVDDHIVQIIDVLNRISDYDSIRVIPADETSWKNVMGGR